MAAKLDQQVIVHLEELARVTAELEAIHKLLQAIHKSLVRMTTPTAIEALFQLDRPV